MLRKLCEYKGVEIIEAEACKDHIHMLVSIPPKYSVSQIMGYLKGKSSLMIYEKYANMKYKYGNRHLLGSGEINHSGSGENRQFWSNENHQSGVASPQVVLFTRPAAGQPVSQ